MVDFRGLDIIQRATALGTVETMKHSQVKNLLLPGLVSKDLIHIPTHTALGRFRSLPNMTKIVLPYAQ